MESKPWRQQAGPVLVGMIVLAFMLIPLAVEYWQTPAGYISTGHVTGGDDYGSYLSKMRQGWEGLWTWQSRMDPEDTGRRPLFLFYLALGHLARWLGLGPEALPVVFYVAGAAGMLVSAWAIGRFMARAGVPAAVGTFMALAGSGVLSPLWPQPHPYIGLYFPHYNVVIAGLSLWMAEALGSGRLWLAAIAGAVVSLVHPQMAGVAALALGLFGLACRRFRSRAWAVAGVGTAAAAPYTAAVAWMFRNDPFVRLWRDQIPKYGITPWLLLVWYGILVVLALAGIVVAGVATRQRKEIGEGAVLATCWIASAVGLSWLSPVRTAGSDYTLAFGVPLAVLAWQAIQRIPERRPWRWLRALAVVTCGAGLFMASWMLVWDPPKVVARHLSFTELRALQAAADCARREGDRPLAVRENLAPLVPWLTGARVWWGHSTETSRSKERRKELPVDKLVEVVGGCGSFLQRATNS